MHFGFHSLYIKRSTDYFLARLLLIISDSFNILCDWRCVMCNEEVKKSREIILSENQNYQVKSILFIVKPIFKEDSDKTLGKALINLMNDEISNL